MRRFLRARWVWTLFVLALVLVYGWLFLQQATVNEMYPALDKLASVPLADRWSKPEMVQIRQLGAAAVPPLRRVLKEKDRRMTHFLLDEADLETLQKRRACPAHLTQRVQIFLHEHLLEAIFDSSEIILPPLPMRMLEKYPRLRRLPARMVGIGFRPEHLGPHRVRPEEEVGFRN
jgi:hypothetical protein